MKLVIENLGVIKQAEIDLSKKFILFCGCNSTGKTYASYILHAFIGNSNLFTLQCTKGIINQINAQGCFSITKEIIEEWLIANCEDIPNNISNIFGISDNSKDKLFSNFRLSVSYTEEDFKRLLHSPITIQLSEGSSIWKIEKKADSNEVALEGNNTDLAKGFQSEMLIGFILRNLTFFDLAGIRMLTVERNSIYTFKTELSLSRNELIDQIQQTNKSEINIIDIINKSSRRYPLAIRSSLKIANDLENIQKFSSPFAEIATQIEQNLLNGEVCMTKDGDVEFHPKSMSKSLRLPFHLSSSIIKTMASLIIYLRHIARKGDTLIIDEPEMNFHPDVQILLARVFAILSTKALRMVVSTHSDYIIREINNLIMAGAICKYKDSQLLEEIGYTSDMLLDYKDVSVLYFDFKGKKVQVKSLDIDEEGFAVDSIDEAINNQNRNAYRLSEELEDLKSNS